MYRNEREAVEWVELTSKSRRRRLRRVRCSRRHDSSVCPEPARVLIERFVDILIIVMSVCFANICGFYVSKMQMSKNPEKSKKKKKLIFQKFFSVKNFPIKTEKIFEKI